MALTILEAHVEPENWAVLERAFDAAADHLPPPLAQSFLVQDTADPTLWRLITQWRSRAALEEYRSSVDTPGGVLMFRAAGVEPALSIFDVRAHIGSDAR